MLSQTASLKEMKTRQQRAKLIPSVLLIVTSLYKKEARLSK